MATNIVETITLNNLVTLNELENVVSKLKRFYGPGAILRFGSSITPEILAAPVNRTVPTIAGTETQGDDLTATPGTWWGAPTLTYQWYRDGVAIVAATAVTHTLVAGDVGHTLTIKETATSQLGSATADSAATGTIAAP